MRAIYQVALRIGLVRDEQNKLLGTVTDGDIRRGLLVNCEMQDSVGRVMNKAPIIAKSTRTVNNASIGKNSIINTGAIVEHYCKIGAHNHLASRVTLSDGVMTASQVHIGTGASVILNIKIGE